MENNYYETEDMSLAAALVATGYKLVNIEIPKAGKRYRFQFIKDTKLHAIATDFWSNSLYLDALTYWNCLKTLKARIYDQQ